VRPVDLFGKQAALVRVAHTQTFVAGEAVRMYDVVIVGGRPAEDSTTTDVIGPSLVAAWHEHE